MNYMKFIPGKAEEFVFDSKDPGEITAVVTACKMANVTHKLYKNEKGNWRIVYFVKPAIQLKFEEVVEVYRSVKKMIV